MEKIEYTFEKHLCNVCINCEKKNCKNITKQVKNQLIIYKCHNYKKFV